MNCNWNDCNWKNFEKGFDDQAELFSFNVKAYLLSINVLPNEYDYFLEMKDCDDYYSSGKAYAVLEMQNYLEKHSV